MKYNFTESSWISDIKSGSGKLLYEQPVVNILGKEVSTLVELQKSLAQFGVNGGNVLSKLKQFLQIGANIPSHSSLSDAKIMRTNIKY